jgi:ligand-binding sensor domain-containing protein
MLRSAKTCMTIAACAVIGAVCFMTETLFADTGARIRGTNNKYQQGDWITYAVTRFVRSIAIGEEYIYFATTGGITRYNFFRNQWDFPWTTSNGLASNDIYLVAKDLNTGYLWCSTDNAVCCLETSSQLWKNSYLDEFGGNASDKIASIGFGNGQVYLVSERGQWFSSGSVSTMFNTVSPVQDTNQSIIWYGAKQVKKISLPHFWLADGYQFNQNNLSILNSDLQNYEITDWVQDPWQNLWLATWGLGAAKGSTVTMNMDLLPFGLFDQSVNAIGIDDKELWIGGIQQNSSQSGITRWLIPGGAPIYFENYLLTGFNNGEISAIVPDGNIIWFGTHNGLTRYDIRRNSWRTFTIANNLVSNWINDIAVDDNAVWIATDQGLSRLNKAAARLDSIKISNVLYSTLRGREIYDLEISGDNLWAGTEVGLFVYEKLQNKGSFYSSVADPVSSPVYALSFIDDELWYGTDQGVSAFNILTGERFNPPAHYQNNLEINKILAAKDAVWIATDQGVFKYDRNGERWVQFTVEDGLPTDKVNAIYLDDNYIWFGTDAGLTRFYWNAPYRLD